MSAVASSDWLNRKLTQLEGNIINSSSSSGNSQHQHQQTAPAASVDRNNNDDDDDATHKYLYEVVGKIHYNDKIKVS